MNHGSIDRTVLIISEHMLFHMLGREKSSGGIIEAKQQQTSVVKCNQLTPPPENTQGPENIKNLTTKLEIVDKLILVVELKMSSLEIAVFSILVTEYSNTVQSR